jgi:Integrase core domain
VEILNLIDDHSRLALASLPRRTITGPDVLQSFQNAFQLWGIPASVLSDNGAVFTGRQRGGGRVALEVELGRLGIRFDHSRPYHPQTCGKVERFQQTQKNWLAAQPPAKTIAGLHRQLDRFRAYYNDVRPHRALGRRTPLEAFTARPKATATGPYIDPHWRVRHDRIDTTGTVTLRHNSRLHHIGLGRRLAGTRITLLVDDLHIRVINRDTGELLRELTLDPTRDFQPRGVPPGPVPRTARK